jgi:hypothetical protein
MQFDIRIQSGFRGSNAVGRVWTYFTGKRSWQDRLSRKKECVLIPFRQSEIVRRPNRDAGFPLLEFEQV